MLQQAHALFRAQEMTDSQSLLANKIEGTRHFDISGMTRAVGIIPCGRSGSFLLCSYLDGHDDVIMIPPCHGDRIYQFFEFYKSLTLLDKLISYPVFANCFQGEFPIGAGDYYAAVKALFEVHGDSPPEFLKSSRAFFLFLHVAYCVALGRLPVSSNPLIVYEQHILNSALARRLVEDFPHARFIHTVRDPISNCSRSLEIFPWSGHLTAAYAVRMLNRYDEPHPGMESRTRTIRFEDLHLHLEKTMAAVTDWLGMPFRSSLNESTFNGVPWAVKRGLNSWSGPRPEQAIRDTRNISITDKHLLFAVFNEDFVAWNYSCPRIFKNPFIRVLTFIFVFIIPMKIEIIEARTFVKNVVSLRRGRFSYAFNGMVRISVCRVAVILLLAVNLCRRLVFGKNVLKCWIV
jgi:hypothetical protein